MLDECPYVLQGGDQGLGRGVDATEDIDTTPLPRYQTKVRFSDLPDHFEAACNTHTSDSDLQNFLGVNKHKSPRGIPKCSKLKIKVEVTFQDGSSKQLLALVDTGAEVNLVNPSLLSSNLFYPSPKPLRLGAANSLLLKGGSRMASMVLTFHGCNPDTKRPLDLSIPFTAYDAEVSCDLILSYGWLAENNIVPNPRRHGLYFVDYPGPAWVSGIIVPRSQGICVLETPTVSPLQPDLQPDESTPGIPDIVYTNLVETWKNQNKRQKIRTYLQCLNLHAVPHHSKMGCPDMPGFADHPPLEKLADDDLDCIIEYLQFQSADVNYIKGFVSANTAVEGSEVDDLRAQILKDQNDSVFSGKTTGSPPKRCEFGEAEIHLLPNSTPVKQRPYQMAGERRAAWIELIDQLIADGKIEPGQGPWCSPSFPVPKKTPKKYRLVVDYRRLNAATEVDSHPLPRINDILQRQGRFKIWSVLDMKDGYHQVPLKEEHRNLTCMSTPRGVMRWRVLVMGLKNGNAIFQRVMEHVLRDIDYADAYVDDVIVGSTGNSLMNFCRTTTKTSEMF